MAKVTIIKAKPVKRPPDKYILELTQDEAQLIKELMGCIGVTGLSAGAADTPYEIYTKLIDLPRRPWIVNTKKIMVEYYKDK